MFFQPEIETMPRRDLEALQLERLKWTVDYCYRNVPFYTKKLDEAGVTADKIKSLADIQYIPPTTKADLRDNYPFGLFAQPMKKIVRIHASSGTTGKPTVVGYTKNDLEMWSDCMARLVMAAGATDEDIVQISFGYGMFTGAGPALWAGENRRDRCAQFQRQHGKSADVYARFSNDGLGFYPFLCAVYGGDSEGAGLPHERLPSAPGAVRLRGMHT